MTATVLWMLGATASFSLLAVAGRELSAELDTFELMLYRSIAGLVLVTGWAAHQGRLAEVHTRQLSRHMLRNVWHFTAQNLWFYGIAVIPLAQLVALEFTNPIWVALLAPLLLGESLTRRKAFAVALGFVGILIVARPGLAPIGPGHLAALGAAVGFAMTSLITRKISRSDTVLCVLFWMSLTQTVASLVLALPGGIPWPSTPLLPYLAIAGVTGLTAHICLTSALALSPATIVGPLEFIRLPVITAIGALVYSEALDIAVLVGAVVILIANIINLTALKRDAAPQQNPR